MHRNAIALYAAAILSPSHHLSAALAAAATYHAIRHERAAWSREIARLRLELTIRRAPERARRRSLRPAAEA